MAIRVRKVYLDDANNECHFVKIENAPGFTHRVIINRRQVDWLAAGTRPSEKSAEFFFQKHSANIPEKA